MMPSTAWYGSRRRSARVGRRFMAWPLPKHNSQSGISRRNCGAWVGGSLRPRFSLGNGSIYEGYSSTRSSLSPKSCSIGNQTWPSRRASPSLAKRFRVMPTALTWKSRSKFCFGMGSDRGGFRAFSASRSQALKHKLAKGCSSGAPAFLARVEFLTVAFRDRVHNTERQYVIEIPTNRDPTFASIVLASSIRQPRTPVAFLPQRGLPNVFPYGKINLRPEHATGLDTVQQLAIDLLCIGVDGPPQAEQAQAVDNEPVAELHNMVDRTRLLTNHDAGPTVSTEPVD